MKLFAILAVLSFLGVAIADEQADTTRPSATMPSHLRAETRPAIKGIVYVCDGSAAVDTVRAKVVQMELTKSVAHLLPVQAFNVILFQTNDDGTKFIALADHLVMANPSNKTKSDAFIAGFTFKGTGDAIPAVEEAFKEKPRLIYLLVAKPLDHPNIQEVADRIIKLNVDRKIQVSTILLIGTEAEFNQYKEFENGLKRIAEENGGAYKKYSADELQGN